MNAAASEPIVVGAAVRRRGMALFPLHRADVSIIRATTADERGNLTYEHEGAYLGGLDQALAAHNNGGIVIAQVKRVVENGSLRRTTCACPACWSTTSWSRPTRCRRPRRLTTRRSAARSSGRCRASALPEMNVQKVIARRAAMELREGMAVNIGFGISAKVPRILLEEGQHGKVTWVIEQGAVGGVPLLDFKFGCAANAQAIMPSPHQFTYFQGGGFDASCSRSCRSTAMAMSMSRGSRRGRMSPPAPAALSISPPARGTWSSAATSMPAQSCRSQMAASRIDAEGKVKKLVNEVEHVTFCGRRARRAGPERDLCHRALRAAAGAGWADRGRTGARRGPRARCAGPIRDPARASPTTSR